jgi:hypothetical protein
MRSGTSPYETRKALTFRGACLWRLCSWQHSPFPMSHSLLMVQSSPAASRDTVVYLIFILTGSLVVKALGCKPEGHGFETR